MRQRNLPSARKGTMAEQITTSERTVPPAADDCGLADEPPQRLRLDISVQAGAWSRESQECIGALAGLIADRVQLAGEPGLATIVLDTDEAVRHLNSVHRGRDAATNVLSFPSSAIDFDTGVAYRGDVILGFETVEREAHALGIPFRDHVTHLICHGVLHLLDFAHETDGEAEVMEALEIAILGELGISNPYVEERSAQTLSA